MLSDSGDYLYRAPPPELAQPKALERSIESPLGNSSPEAAKTRSRTADRGPACPPPRTAPTAAAGAASCSSATAFTCSTAATASPSATA